MTATKIELLPENTHYDGYIEVNTKLQISYNINYFRLQLECIIARQFEVTIAILIFSEYILDIIYWCKCVIQYENCRVKEK